MGRGEKWEYKTKGKRNRSHPRGLAHFSALFALPTQYARRPKNVPAFGGSPSVGALLYSYPTVKPNARGKLPKTGEYSHIQDNCSIWVHRCSSVVASPGRGAGFRRTS